VIVLTALGEVDDRVAGLDSGAIDCLAEAHSGHVRAADADGWHGARFELILPGFEPRSVSQ
jgi:hypothetical protein